MKVDYIFLLFYFITFNYLKSSTAEENYCYFHDNDPYIQFATKSAYELVRAKKTQTIPSCKPVTIWASIRHGTRYPGIKTIEEMKSLIEVRDQIVKNRQYDGRGQLCDEDLQMIRNWTYRLSPSYENKLSTQGKDDLRFLAKRLKSQFASILDTSYSSERFAFFNDGTERTVESTNAFIDGLFGPDIIQAHTNSSLLNSPDDCHAWVHGVKNNSDTFKEQELFRKSTYVQKLIIEVSNRLGFANNLTLDIIELMYDTCRFEKAWYIASRPPFCSAFSKENLKILEYMQDLKYYYEYSYGNDMNKKLGCPLVADMVKRFNDVAEGNNKSNIKPSGIFYFSHTAAHIPILTLLRIKEDNEHLFHNNYEAMSKREFMTSIISPFSANLIAAFYKCSVGEENRVIFYLNEDVVRYPGCDVGLCSWKSFYDKFKPVVESDSCNFDFCKSTGTILAFETMKTLYISIFLISIHWFIF